VSTADDLYSDTEGDDHHRGCGHAVWTIVLTTSKPTHCHDDPPFEFGVNES
jgi:hypothetical protein